MRILFLVTFMLTNLLLTTMAVGGPTEISYQGRLTDSGGNTIDSFFDITFRLYPDAVGTNILWEETHGVTVTGGLFSVRLGTISSLDMSAMPVHPDFLWLGIQVGSDAELSPRTRLSSVPAATVASSLQGDVSIDNGRISMIDSLGDTTILWDARAAKGVVQSKPPTPGSKKKQTEIGAGDLTLSAIGPSGLDSSFLEIIVDSSGGSILMNKADLIEAIASDASLRIDTYAATQNLRIIGPSGDTSEIILIVDTAEAKFSLTKKKDAKKKSLEAFISNTSMGLSIVDSTLNDSALIDLRIDNSGNSGIDIMTKKKVVKFRAGVELAKTVAKAADNGREGAYMGLAGALDRYVEITVDSVGSSLVFGDTLGDTTVVLEADGGGNGRVTVIANNSAMGLAQSRIEIADLDSDGLLDLRVDGKVGIGVAIPGNILEVQQSSATDPIADAWTVYSSRRWKENINTIDNALEKVLKLRGVEYDWKADGKHDIGLIAEEVGEVIPDIVVYEQNGTDAKSVDYSRLVALLIEASKEQQKQIDDLKKLVQILTNRSKTNKSNFGMK